MTTREIIEGLQEALKREDYKAVWFANLAMCVYDEMPADMEFAVKRNIASGAADRFINLLLSDDTP